jgi:hypothetical protein
MAANCQLNSDCDSQNLLVYLHLFAVLEVQVIMGLRSDIVIAIRSNQGRLEKNFLLTIHPPSAVTTKFTLPQTLQLMTHKSYQNSIYRKF